MIRICFVCLGNICRSPTAEAVMRHVVRQERLESVIEIDSAGTGSWHVGESADSRARQTARSRGFDLGGEARQFRAPDFKRFEYVVAMDRANRRDLRAMARSDEERESVHLLRDFDPGGERGLEVPDPYYGGPDGFEIVFDICEAACRGMLEHIRTHDRL